MSSVLSPVLGLSTSAESPSSSSRNSTKNTPPPPRRSDSSDPPPPPSDSSAPPPKADPTVPEAPPPSNSEPPPAPPPSSPPPPDLPTSPPPSDPPPPPNEPPPVENPPPPNAPPPEENPPPPPKSPPKHSRSPPPPDHEASPPSPPADPPSPPPPPADVSPPSSEATPPSYSPPPPDVVQAPPPSDIIPHNTTAPPPNIPSSFAPPTIPPPAPGSNTSTPNNLAPPPAPSVLTEKPPSPTNSTASPSDAGGIQGGSVVAVAFVGFLTLSLVVFAVCFMQRRKKKRNKLNLGYMRPSPFSSSQNSDSLFIRNQQSPLNSANHSPYHSTQLSGSASTNSFAYSGDSGGLGSSRSWFTYEELAAATNGFSESSILGEGGFGYVYKGNLGDGKVVAVKQLKSGGGQGEREFRAEVEIISRIHHRHLVSLVGYCIADVQRLLVYDYVPNDTLYHHLHGKGPVMTWANRFKCAIGAARGLAYLHEDCNPKIIHRDIKSANILLENNFEAKVADFGLARLALELDVHTHVSTRVMGTFGYMAPEYATTGKLTEKSDVFSYGVVLLEMITGRKPVDSTRPVFDEGLVEWARPLLAQAIESENFDGIVDPRLENNFVKIEMFRLIEAAAACVRHFASKRPKMSQVARALESVEEISDLTNGLKPGESQIYDPRQQSTQMRMFQKMAFGSQEYSSDFNNSQSSWKSGL